MKSANSTRILAAAWVAVAVAVAAAAAVCTYVSRGGQGLDTADSHRHMHPQRRLPSQGRGEGQGDGHGTLPGSSRAPPEGVSIMRRLAKLLDKHVPAYSAYRTQKERVIDMMTASTFVPLCDWGLFDAVFQITGLSVTGCRPRPSGPTPHNALE